MKMRFDKRKQMAYAEAVAKSALHNDTDERSRDIWDIIEKRNLIFYIEKSMSFLDESGKSLLASSLTHSALYKIAQLRGDGDLKERVEAKLKMFSDPNEIPERCLVTIELEDGFFLTVLGRSRMLSSELNEKLGNGPLPFVTYIIPASQFESEHELQKVIYEIAQKGNAPKSKDIDPEKTSDLMNTLLQGYNLYKTGCQLDGSEPLSAKDWSFDFLDKYRPHYSDDANVRIRLINKAFKDGHGTNIPEVDMKQKARDVYESVFDEPWHPENENVIHKTSVGIHAGDQGYVLNILQSSFFGDTSTNIAYWMLSVGSRDATSTSGIERGRKKTIKTLNAANIRAEALGLQVVHRVVFMGQTTDVDVEVWEWRNTKKEMIKKS
jgi:hypothetical protein